MKTIAITLILISLAMLTRAQGDNIPEGKFHQGSNLFINGNPEAALAAVNEGLRVDPKNLKLTELKKILEQEKKKQEQQKKEQQEQEKKDKQKQEQQKDQQNKEKKDQQDKDQEKKDDKDQKDKDQKDQKDQQSKEEQQKKEQEQKDSKEQDQKENKDKELPQEVMDKLKEMKISEDKARMILDAMKNQEIQYIQQNKRQSAKPRDKSKPDW